MRLSIIIPALNEAAAIGGCLEALQPLRRSGHEVIVVDGGSEDGTAAAVRDHADVVLVSEPGRAVQMNRGVEVSSGDVLVFLHVDTSLPEGVHRLIESALGRDTGWGRFDVRLTGSATAFRIIEFCMNLRSRITGIGTGDQAMFVSRSLFREAGGFAPVPLMEDIELSARLKRVCRPLCLRARVTTSSRRWEQEGIMRTILKMWMLRLRYAMGTDAAVLARNYD